MEELIKELALHNAVKYNGTANPKALIGKVIGTFPDARKDMKGTMEKIHSIVEKINSMKPEEQVEELKRLAPEKLEEKKQPDKGLKELTVTRDVVMRMEPSPSGPLHIGHAYPASLNYAYAKMYKGKMIMRISDTNPENIDPDAYELIKEDASWLFRDEYEYYIQSDRIELYYQYAKILLEKSSAYICTCDPEEVRELMKNKTGCPCRDLDLQEQLQRWEKMLTSYNQGEAVMRFKSDITHKNPAMRDFALMRVNTSPHPKQGTKYRVWPLMNMSVAVDDMLMKVSHTLRGKDHMDNAKKQAMIHEVLGYETPFAISVGRINFEGFPVSCSKTRKLIEEGKYEGWDDIRIPFLRPIRHRGYLPETLIDYAIEVGVTQTDKSVSIENYFKTINSINRSKLDEKAKRFFFIKDPKEITVKDAPKQTLYLSHFPNKKDKQRKFVTGEKFFIEREDFEKMDTDKMYRLMDCLNFTLKNFDETVFHSLEHEHFKAKGESIIHWVSEGIPCTVVMPDNTEIQGLAEPALQEAEKDEIIQFERFGFCKIVSKDPLRVWYGHK